MDTYSPGISDRRLLPNRRRRTLHGLLCSLYKRRRIEPQRHDERRLPHYTDIYEPRILVLLSLTLILCAADGFLTLEILDKGGVELNPLMAELLTISDQTFLLVKSLITGIGIVFFLFHINFSLLKLFSVRQIIYVLFILYAILVAYELILLQL